jgi:hypothetical protein
MPALLKMKNFMQSTGRKLYQTPLKPVCIILAVKVYRTAKNSAVSAHLQITMVIGSFVRRMIAVIIQQCTDQNTISIEEWHKKSFCSINRVIETYQRKIRNYHAEGKLDEEARPASRASAAAQNALYAAGLSPNKR